MPFLLERNAIVFKASESSYVLRHQETRLMPYTPAFLYALVADVEQYPHFLPWCRSVEITKRNKKLLEATVGLEIAGFQQDFRSRVFLEPTHKIAISYLKGGPLKSLESTWHFKPKENDTLSCQVDFDIAFSLSSVLLDKLLGTALQKIAKEMVKAFEKRAKELSLKEKMRP